MAAISASPFPPPPSTDGELSQIIQRIYGALNLLRETNDCQEATRDRLLGALPTAAAGATGEAYAPGAVGEINGALSALIAQCERASDLVKPFASL